VFRVLGTNGAKRNPCAGVMAAAAITAVHSLTASAWGWVAASTPNALLATPSNATERSEPMESTGAMEADEQLRAADPTAPCRPIEAVDRAREQLSTIEAAHRGVTPRGGLRLARLAVEAKLERSIASMTVDLRPGEFAALGDARGRLNQAIIRCQEWEFFGPHDRPEWGWYPSRKIRSSEQSVVVDATAAK